MHHPRWWERIEIDPGEIEQWVNWLDVQVGYTESGMRKLVARVEYSFKKPAPIPAKSETAWLTSYEKRAGVKRRGKANFVDGAHLLRNAVPTQGWIKRGHTVELRTSSGQNRLNVLGADSPDDLSLVSIAKTASCDIGLVSRLLDKLLAANPARQLLVVPDNASYQRAYAVCTLATQLNIQLLFLPPYSPNLNLIERFWKFFHPTFTEFRSAVHRVLNNVAAFADELSTLTIENLHLFGIDW